MSTTEEEVLSKLQSKIQQDENDDLCEDHLPHLFRALHDLAANWHGLSLQLGVTGQGQIQQNGRSADDCLALALYQWLKSGDASWTSLIAAIFRPAGGGHHVLAQKIASSYKDLYSFQPHGFSINVSTESIGDGFEKLDNAVAHIQNLLGHKVASRWYQMGVILGVPVSELESIRNGQETNAGLREAAMLRSWLQTSLLSQTWQVLVDAIEHDAGGNHRALAKNIAKKINTEQGASNVTVASDGANNGRTTSVSSSTSSTTHTTPVQSPTSPAFERAQQTDTTQAVNPSSPPTEGFEKISRTSEPDLIALMSFPKAGGSIDIATEIGSSYSKFGIFLLNDKKGAQVAAMEKQHNYEAAEINRAIFRKWLEGANKVEVTWDWLVNCLKRADLHALAKEVENGLKD